MLRFKSFFILLRTRRSNPILWLAQPRRQIASGRSCFGPESNFEVQLLSEGAMIGSTMTDDRVEIVQLESFPASDPPAFVAGGVLAGRPLRSDGIESAAFDPAPAPPSPSYPLRRSAPGHRARADASTGGLASSSPRGRRNKRGGLRFLKPGVRHLLHYEKAAYRSRHRWLYRRD
jgi:hypothetical protein